MEKINISFSNYVQNDRKKIALLLKKVISSLIEDKTDFMETIRNIAEYYENLTGYYPVLSLGKDDIREAGYNPDTLSHDDMRNISDNMPQDSMMDSFWVSLKYYLAEEYKLPELRTEMDSIYEEYKREYGKEPLYATIWLEDKGHNNLPWQETIKLSSDIVDKEDDLYVFLRI